jgi:hypothetical protein
MKTMRDEPVFGVSPDPAVPSLPAGLQPSGAIAPKAASAASAKIDLRVMFQSSNSNRLDSTAAKS